MAASIEEFETRPHGPLIIFISFDVERSRRGADLAHGFGMCRNRAEIPNVDIARPPPRAWGGCAPPMIHQARSHDQRSSLTRSPHPRRASIFLRATMPIRNSRTVRQPRAKDTPSGVRATGRRGSSPHQLGCGRDKDGKRFDADHFSSRFVPSSRHIRTHPLFESSPWARPLSLSCFGESTLPNV